MICYLMISESIYKDRERCMPKRIVLLVLLVFLAVFFADHSEARPVSYKGGWMAFYRRTGQYACQKVES